MVLSQSPAIELSESQKAVLQKYLINGETTWEEVVQRVARFVASAEATPELQKLWQEKFLSILLPMKFVPGGSILANCEHGTKGLLNCFVLSAGDNIYDITKLVSDSVLTTKFRGGVGINIGAAGQKGYIRPKGAPFKDGLALGPCAVLDMVSENCKKITTGNKSRRGAFLFSIDWRHPDVWEFIQAKTQSVIDAGIAKSIIEQMAQLVLSDQPEMEKRQQLKELNQKLSTAWVETHLNPEGKRDRRWHNANISVQLDDEFFQRLDQGDEQANKLWNQIAEYAHKTADPGLLLIDNAKRRSPIRDFITCTNPCVTADTWVHTGDGPRQVKELIGVQHQTYVDGVLYSTTPAGFFQSGHQPQQVFSLQTQEGFRLRLTANHQILKVIPSQAKPTLEWVEVSQLQAGDQVKLHNHRHLQEWNGRGSTQEGWLLGTLIGNGEFKDEAKVILKFSEGKTRDYALSCLNRADHETAYEVFEVARHARREHTFALYSPWITELAASFGVNKTNKQITQHIEKASFEFYQGFLQGLFDMNARVRGLSSKDPDREAAKICLAHNSLDLLEKVQRMLLRMGIVAAIRSFSDWNWGHSQTLGTAIRALEAGAQLPLKSESEFATSGPATKYELIITNDNIRVFEACIGFRQSRKARELNRLIHQFDGNFPLAHEDFCVTVQSVEVDGIELVYDCSVPTKHCFDANGLMAHNCGEIFLPPNSACNLGSLVLTKFVSQQANGDLAIDWEDLAETVRIAIRFLDNVLDVSEFATPDQKQNVQHIFRQLGLGIMGWADYLKLARISYDSVAHLEEIDRWGSWIAHHAYRMSEAIAQEKGPCGIWPQIAAIRTGNAFERWVDSEGNAYDGVAACNSERQDLQQVPRRNSTVLSIAPTGSIAQLAACSWAFEPDFGLTVWKQVFVDASRSQQNWVQILNPYLEALDLSGADSETVKRTGSLKQTAFAKAHPEIAESFKIAREIPPGWHILVQSKWQDWIDSSISKTINLPAHATVAEIKQIYRLAEKAGLKGVTIYRSGTLESEPIKVGDEEKS